MLYLLFLSFFLLTLGGNIGEEQVALTHFGGFVKKSVPSASVNGGEDAEEGEEGEGTERGEARKSKKDVMSELIAKSKYYKVKKIIS